MQYDVIVVGGGPAGLSAALVLGRCRRKVIVFDHGRPRNRASHGVHGFLSRDGIDPLELLRLGREEIAQYGVTFEEAEVIDGRCDDSGAIVTLSGGRQVRSRKLLLATGICDELPPIPGIEALYGRSVHHCPYCDGWEWRERRIAVYGRNQKGAGLALALRTWTDHVTLCTDGDSDIEPDCRAMLNAQQIAVRVERITGVEADGPWLRRVLFEQGEALAAEAMFFSTSRAAGCDLPERLGCRMHEPGIVATGKAERTNVPNLWVAGDASKDMQFAIVAAAEGAKAAVAINQEFQEEEGRRVAE